MSLPLPHRVDFVGSSLVTRGYDTQRVFNAVLAANVPCQVNAGGTSYEDRAGVKVRYRKYEVISMLPVPPGAAVRWKGMLLEVLATDEEPAQGGIPTYYATTCGQVVNNTSEAVNPPAPEAPRIDVS